MKHPRLYSRKLIYANKYINYILFLSNRKLQKAEEQIELLSDGLDSVDKNVSELREQLNVNTKEAAEIELNINKEKKTIEAAQKLVEKLDDEFSRWGLQVQYTCLKNFKKFICLLILNIKYNLRLGIRITLYR